MLDITMSSQMPHPGGVQTMPTESFRVQSPLQDARGVDRRCEVEPGAWEALSLPHCLKGAIQRLRLSILYMELFVSRTAPTEL